jgi:hypothetical protein
MSLNNIVRFLVDENGSNSLHLRAICLFEFQVALFYPNSYRILVASARASRGSTRRLRNARIYAATKFLDDIQMRFARPHQSTPISIRKFAKDPTYRDMFDNVFIPNGGWPSIRHSTSAKSFDKEMLERRAEAEVAAKLIDFSYRFQPSQNDGRWKGGITMAIHVVRRAVSYGILRKSKNTIRPHWNDFESTSVFLYLLLHQGFPLMPPKVSKSNFSRELLSQAEDSITLRRFFRAYQHLCEALAPRGYRSFDILRYDLKCEVPSLSRVPFEHDVVAAIQEYKEANSKPEQHRPQHAANRSVGR